MSHNRVGVGVGIEAMCGSWAFTGVGGPYSRLPLGLPLCVTNRDRELAWLKVIAPVFQVQLRHPGSSECAVYPVKS